MTGKQSFIILWWQLESTITHYFVFDFLSHSNLLNRKKYLPLWLSINVLLSLIVISFQIPGAFFIDAVFIALFTGLILQIPIKKLTAPLSVILTLLTLKEGFSAVTLSWASQRLILPAQGLTAQILFSALLTLLSVFALRMIQFRYACTFQKSISAYLYILLLPCSFFLLLIRFSLRLDSSDFPTDLINIKPHFWITLLFLIIGAAGSVFLILELFYKIIFLSEKETQTAVLTNQLNNQKIFLEEAKQRNINYASFQHDIDNHLLVLSGLLREKKHTLAEQYLQQLKTSCQAFSFPISTGNDVLDVLLSEKIKTARSNQINIECNVKIPSEFKIDELHLCVLFSNIMDNAIAACQKIPQEKRYISLVSAARSHLLTLEAVNSAPINSNFQESTGLHNIRHIAEQYHGITEIKYEKERFQISVLICEK